MPVRVGTSGWQYRHWRGVLYPAGLALYDAAAFASLARRAGRQVTATPTPGG